MFFFKNEPRKTRHWCMNIAFQYYPLNHDLVLDTGYFVEWLNTKINSSTFEQTLLISLPIWSFWGYLHSALWSNWRRFTLPKLSHLIRTTKAADGDAKRDICAGFYLFNASFSQLIWGRVCQRCIGGAVLKSDSKFHGPLSLSSSQSCFWGFFLCLLF